MADSDLDSEAQLLLIRKIAELEEALAGLARMIIDDTGRPAWADGQDKPVKARQVAAEFIRRIDYTDDRDPGSTERLQALLGSSEETLNRAHKVNHIKKELHELLMCLDAGVLEPPRGEPTRRPWTSGLLAAIGRARFNRRQATRHLVILPEKPLAASFFWGRVRKIIRISRADAQALLEKRLSESGDTNPALRYQYDCLLNLPENEPLAQVQQLRDYPRVNLVFPPGGLGQGNGKPVRKQVMAITPLFYPAEPFAPAPEAIPLPDPEMKRQRLRRNDLSIELRPFLPAIRVHRYIRNIRRPGESD